MNKYIHDVFKDFNLSDNILSAQIENINLYKKTNKLQVDIISEKPITIAEIGNFENYLQNRFNINKVLTNIKYTNVQINPNINENWDNIVSYITKKEPFSKALLTNSKVQVENKNINVNLKMKGAEFLLNKKFDKGLEHLLQNVYNDNFIVKINDDLNDEYYSNIEKNLLQEEKEAIKIINEKNKKVAIASQDAEIEMAIATESSGFINSNVNESYQNNNKELPEGMIFGRSAKLKGANIKINDISPETENVVISGEVIRIDSNDMKSKPDKSILIFDVYDGTNSITCKAFVQKNKLEEYMKKMYGKSIKVDGVARYDNFAKEITLIANSIFESKEIKKNKREDKAETKRVELHMHTQMSQMDGITPCEDLIKRAISWGWKSIAITDHGVVQSFPDAHKLLEKNKSDIKVIYGVEAYFAPDKDPCVFNSKGQSIDTEYCVLDLETTGISYLTEKITEIRNYKN